MEIQRSFSSIQSSVSINSEEIQENIKTENSSNGLYKKQNLIHKIDIFNHLDESDKIILQSYQGTAIPTLRLTELLNIPGFKRTKDQIQELIDIVQEIKFFKEAKCLQNYHFQEIVKTLQIVHIKKGKTVIEFGEQADQFYIILKGQVGINIPNPLLKNWRERLGRYQELKKWFEENIEDRKAQYIKNKQEQVNETVDKAREQFLKMITLAPHDYVKECLLNTPVELDQVNTYCLSKKDTSSINYRDGILGDFQFQRHLNLTQEDMLKIYEYDKLSKLQWFVKAVTLGEGHSFGELGIIDNKPRRATVLCLKDCTFAIYSKTQYKKIFEEIEKQERIKKMKFFQQLPFLAHWSYKGIENLLVNFREKKFIKNQVVYKQNESVNEVYIVQSGEFQISRETKVQKLVDQNFRTLIGPQSSDKFVKISPRGKIKTIKINLSVVGASQIFGHEDILRGKQRTTQVTCLSLTGSIYCISAQEFVVRFLRDDKTWKNLKKNAEVNDNKVIERMRLRQKMKKFENTQRNQTQMSLNTSPRLHSQHSNQIKSQQFTNPLQKTINFKTSQLDLISETRYSNFVIQSPKNSPRPTLPLIRNRRYVNRSTMVERYHSLTSENSREENRNNKSEVSSTIEILSNFQRRKDLKYVKIAMLRKAEKN